MNEIIFFSSIFFVFYAYFGYPLSLHLITWFKQHKVSSGIYYIPYTSIIIAAHNEEKAIKDKIENTLSLIYPRNKLQIIIASDGSTDNTDIIVNSYIEKGVELLVIPKRGGKEHAQKEAIKRASGEILIFTDVATILEPSGVKQIVSNFSDSSIGCVSSEDRVISKGGNPRDENLYVMYEMWLRRLESSVHSVVGLSGSFFAARKAVCMDFSVELDSDFRTLLNSIKKGMRGVSDRKAIGYYMECADDQQEFDRRVRTVLRGLTVFFNNLEFLNFFKYGLFSYQYFCHKLLRWLVPIFLVFIFISNFFIANKSSAYLVSFLVQVILFIVFITIREENINNMPKPVRIIIFFIKTNFSVLTAWVRFMRGDRIITWSPTKRG